LFLVVAMALGPMLAQAAVNRGADATVNSYRRADLRPIEIPCLGQFGSLKLDEQLSCLRQSKSAGIADLD
jgi:hypothetical protein